MLYMLYNIALFLRFRALETQATTHHNNMAKAGHESSVKKELLIPSLTS